MADASKKSRLFEFALIFAVAYVLSQVLFRMFFPAPAGNGEGKITLVPQDATVRGGHHAVLTVKNGTQQELLLPDRCPEPPVDVFLVENAGTPQESLNPLTTMETTVPCVPVTRVGAGEQATLSLAPWKYSLFARYGTFEVRLPKGTGEASARFEVYEPGAIVKLFRTFVTKPFLNFLVFVAGILPDHNLGIAIIVLTFLVKLLLFFPTQHSMEGQRKMQKLQPKLEALRSRHGSDPKRLQEETVKLWKEEKVNPFSSCLPIFLQFPILIGLYFVIRDGSVLELSREFLYPAYHDLLWSFNPHFLGLNLTQPNIYVMPPLLAILQFAQMKLSFASMKKKADAAGGSQKNAMQDTQQMMMLYGLPVMIGVFSFQVPAAVALYWGVSTLFGIGQQLVVNRRVK